MSFQERRSKQQLIEQQRNINEQQLELLQGFAADDAKNPLWALLVPLQGELAKAIYDGQHGDHIFELVQNEGIGNGQAGVWGSWLKGERYPFLSVQATPRPVPRAQAIIEPGVLDEIIAMIEDVNSNNKEVSAVLIRMAITSFKDLIVTVIDADPDGNKYFFQAYTKDYQYLIDIQIHYDVIQAVLQDER
jgi:hypothetical protein